MSVKNILPDSVIQGTNTIKPTGSTFISMEAAVGTLTEAPNIQGVDATNSNFIKYTPNDAGTTSWNQWASSFANGGGRRNQVMRFGWNVSGGGGLDYSGGTYNGALASEYEQYFEGSYRQMERHETFVNADGYQTRWLSFAGSVEDNTHTSLDVRSNTINMGTGRDTSGPNQLTIGLSGTNVRSIDGFKRLRLDDTVAVLEAGTTNSPTVSFTADPGGDASISSIRGFLVGTGTGTARLEWYPGQTGLYAPNHSDGLTTSNGQTSIANSGTALSAFLTNSTTTYIKAATASVISTNTNGDTYVTGDRGFLGAVGANHFKWTSTSSDVFSPDGNTDLYVDNAGFQLIANSSLVIRSDGDYLNLNAGNSGITIKKSGSRAFRTAGVGETAGQLFGNTDNVSMNLVEGENASLNYVDSGNNNAVKVVSGVVSIMTAGVERMRVESPGFRPSTNGTYKNGDNGSRWSEVWTVDLYASGTSNVGSLIPITNDVYSIGSSSNEWHDGYFAGILSLGDGTLTLPSYTFSSNTGNGMFHYPARGGNSISWSTGGAEQMALSGTNLISPQRIVTIDDADLFLDNNVKIGATLYPSNNNTQSFGDSVNYWKDGYVTNSHSSWFDIKMGAQLIVSANAITPTSGLHHVDATGGVAINTINTTNIPYGSTVELILIADAGAITLGTTNIKTGGSIAQDTAQKLIWDGSFWFLVA